MGLQHLSKERRREIAAKGGSSVPASSRAFSDVALAKSAGSKGGLATKKKRLDNDRASAQDDK